MELIIYKWLTFLLPTLTAVVSWFAGRAVRNNSTLQKMQESIDMLVGKNNLLYQKVIDQNMQLVRLQKENAELKRQVETNNQTISRLETEVVTLRDQLTKSRKLK